MSETNTGSPFAARTVAIMLTIAIISFGAVLVLLVLAEHSGLIG